MERDVRYETDGHVGIVTLDRPQVHNALRRRTYDELTELVRTADARVLAVTGAGRSFCSGDDVRELMSGGAEGAAPRPEPRLTPAAGALLDTGIPVIAALKRGLRRALDPDWDDLGAWVSTTLGDLFTTEDHREGVRSFLEKRDPHYVGR